ncbi:MAG: phage tail protein [Firmicutes bacterium HGW-Firmicutes-2]|jgi:phi13 family phage major tail protein|nr:MAG: phage tail protein [Firmicutes bacterium HGW-Firmicutes-2]
MPENKVKFGLKNVHYAVVTETEGVITYATPVNIPGAVSISLSAEGEESSFYADDIKYFNQFANNGYAGDLEMALIPDDFRVAVLGDVVDDNGVLFENTNGKTKNFALLFEFNGDANATRHILYNTSASRPSISSQTKGESLEVQTESLTMSASAALDTGDVKAKAKVGDSPYETWYTTVYKKTIAAGV